MDHIIIKYYEKFSMNLPGIPDRWTRYAKVTVANGKKIRAKEIDRKEAMDTIRKEGLALVHVDTQYGKIWDTPGKSFQKKYKGIAIPNDFNIKTQ